MKLTKNNYPPLNLPPANLTIRRNDSRPEVFDPVRGRYVTLTPEEWVRQHFVNFLIDQLSYPKALIANEVFLTLNSTERRADTIVYDRQAAPLVVVEYKAADVKLTRGVLEQALRYNITLNAPFLFLSNGLQHYAFHIKSPLEAVALKDLPTFEQCLAMRAGRSVL